ncbi:hypothetical protein [Bacteroides eggerthii]
MYLTDRTVFSINKSKEWIDTRPISDESARAFLAWHEEYAMNHQEQ